MAALAVSKCLTASAAFTSDPVMNGWNSANKPASFKKCMESCSVHHQADVESLLKKQTIDPEIQSQVVRSVVNVIENLNTQNQQINQILDRVVSGGKVSDGELLALQGMLLNFNREIMAVSKITESLISMVKTTLQTQV